MREAYATNRKDARVTFFSSWAKIIQLFDNTIHYTIGKTIKASSMCDVLE